VFSSIDILSPYFTFLEDSDSKQKSLLERIVGTQSISRARDLAEVDLRILKDQKATLNTRDFSLSERINDAKNRLRSCLDQAVNTKERYNSLIKTIGSKIEQADREISSETKLLAENKILLADLMLLRDELKLDSEEHTLKARIAQEKSIEALTLYLECSAAYKASNEACEALQRQLTAFDSLSLDESCLTCGQEVQQGAKDAYHAKIEEQFKAARSHAHEISEILEQATENKEELAKLAGEAFKRSDDTHKKYFKAIKDISAFENLISSRKDSINYWSTHKDNFQNQINSASGEAVSVTAIVDKLETELNKLEEERNQLQTELVRVSTELDYISFWVNGFSPKGLPSFILDSVMPELNMVISENLKQLSSEMNLRFQTQSTLKSSKELRDKINIDFTSPQGAFSFKGTSSGEKRRIQVASVFGLRHIRSINQSDHNLFIIDEALVCLGYFPY
jgi:DNA repair exonuclease SbcCD ATPase subunit